MTTRTSDHSHVGAALFARLFRSAAIHRYATKLSVSLIAMAATAAVAQTVYMQDTPADTGIEPNPDTGPMWVSEDIWVRNSPDPGWQPYPFTEGSPPWSIPAHQNPVYRDPLKSTPNYVYVQVRNHGNVASTGKERLRLYWAKASTGLAWPAQWVDYQPGGLGTPLYAGEITKPRINAASATAAERTAYVNAIVAIGTTAAYTFPMGEDYWHTQQEVHMQMGANSNIHRTSAFTPWHREFINRYEILLQQYDPKVKLLYWDWTTDPSTTLTFMGGFSGSIGAPFNPSSGPTLSPPAVSRGWSTSYAVEPDSLVVNRGAYGPFSFSNYGCGQAANAPFMAPLEGCSHDDSHGNVGGTMGNPATSAQDPFFFLLHANVDRLWAEWQRNPAALSRLDPAQTYGALDQNLSETMSPWDGSPGAAGNSASSFQIQPWETSTPAPSGGNYVVAKYPSDASVVSPPIYDLAPLVVPILQPGQAVVLQIPWYPPNPADFASFGTDQGHVCLLARIETAATAPFGMTFPEGTDVFANTKNNNKIVWKNVTVVDDLPGPHGMRSVLVRNPFARPVQLGLRLSEPQRAGGSIFRQGRIYLHLPRELYQRWREGGEGGRAVKAADGEAGRIEVQSSDAMVRNIRLNPGETFSVGTEVLLSKNYAPAEKTPYLVDLIQTGTPEDAEKIVGGQRFSFDLRELVLVKSGDEWRYWDRSEAPQPEWKSVDFNDARWRHGTAPFGSDGSPATRLAVAAQSGRELKSYFRRVFEVEDPAFYRTLNLRLAQADGAVAYLNGREIDRVNLPAGTAKSTTIRKLSDLEGGVFVSEALEPALLRSGKNVLAVEVQGSPHGEVRFNAELVANSAAVRRPPEAAFARLSSPLYQPGEKIPVAVEALADGGKIESVSLYVDGARVSTQKTPPYSFVWTAGSPGAHRLRAVAIDAQGMQSAVFQTITIVEHVPPTVKLLEPHLSAAGAARGVTVEAEASDRLGKIVRVEFWVNDMAAFTTPNIRAATVEKPPYRAVLTDLKPGHYMLWAFAVNDHGVTSQSAPAHFVIAERK
jgi:Common central domain of tyrosinase/Bacterial Ig domain